MMPKKQIDGGDFFLNLLASYREVSGRSYGETGGDRLWNFMEGYCTALALPRRIKNFLRDRQTLRGGVLAEDLCLLDPEIACSSGNERDHQQQPKHQCFG